MKPVVAVTVLALIAAVTGCGDPEAAPPADAAAGDASADADHPDAANDTDAALPIDAPDGACATAVACAAEAEQHAADRFDAILNDPAALTAFLTAVPKGGDLHNHLSGAVYAEAYLDWARADGTCINPTSFVATASCGTAQPAPTSGAFYNQIIDAWSMRNFMAGAENGHDHFFATFGKFGLIAGAHRDDELADIVNRAASENQVYVETMFNLGRNVGTLAASKWTAAPSSMTVNDLQGLYTAVVTDPTFMAQVNADVAVVTSAVAGYRGALGCADEAPPSGCDVQMRFVAQVSRTGANDQIFGQLIGSFEMARITGQLVGANLSSPEDDSAAIANYDLHMEMLAFLYRTYTMTGLSPLGVTLHAGELSPTYLPPGSTANTFHIRRAVEVARARRIGHGVDVMSETNPIALLDDLHARDVLVEVCLSSNDQILQISGANHPLAMYLAHGVPVALATDDQGVSRSSLAGEYRRAALDQGVDYRQLKTLARNSLQHAFVPGAALWTNVGAGQPVAACASATTAVGGTPEPACQTFLMGSERARLQWELERRFLEFERLQPAS